MCIECHNIKCKKHLQEEPFCYEVVCVETVKQTEQEKRTSEEVEDKKKPAKTGGTQSQVKRQG